MTDKEMTFEAMNRFVKSTKEEYFASVLGGEDKVKLIGRVWKNIGTDLEILKELLVHEYIVSVSKGEEDREVYKLALENLLYIFRMSAEKVSEEE
jgi:hypothetical protein